MVIFIPFCSTEIGKSGEGIAVLAETEMHWLTIFDHSRNSSGQHGGKCFLLLLYRNPLSCPQPQAKLVLHSLGKLCVGHSARHSKYTGKASLFHVLCLHSLRLH